MVQNVFEAFRYPDKLVVKDILGAVNFIASYTDVIGKRESDIHLASNEIFQLGREITRPQGIDKLYGQVRRMELEVSKKQKKYLMLLGLQKGFYKGKN